jgi:hypothetical protein
MTAAARARAELPDPLPPMSTVLGAIDLEARRTAQRAARHGVAAVRQRLPARTGTARRGQRSSVKRTGVGYVITIAPSSRERYSSGVTAVEVTRWIEGGTGEHGPRGRPIRARRGRPFRLPGGWFAQEVQGQRARHVYDRVRSSEDAAVERILGTGLRGATMAAERALGGT